MKFSSRYKASQGNKELIFDDAPREARIGFYKAVLIKFVSEMNERPKPGAIDSFEIHKEFCALIRDEREPWDYDEHSAWEGLTCHLKECKWLEFFDFVEMFGKKLLEWDDNPFVPENEQLFGKYQSKSNALFEEDGIGWRINNRGELTRHVPKFLMENINSAEKYLTDRFESARTHYKKAKSYLFNPPLDPANSIKEMVSALESVGRTLYPKCSTLGDVIKNMKIEDNSPKLLLAAYEKIYAYSNDTPTVRHGHPNYREIEISEAELFLLTGVAFIRYLIDTHNKANSADAKSRASD
jgi:hypothetical protein